MKTEAIMSSSFGSDKKTGWIFYSESNVEYLLEDNTYFARVKSSKSRAFASAISPVFSLEPSCEYELSFYIRIPKESKPHVINDFYFSPTVVLYQPELSESGLGVSTLPKGDETSNNLYAYKGVRRGDFSAIWEIEGVEPYIAKGTSILSKKEQYEIFGDVADLNLVYSNWKKVTAKFTAVSDVENEYSQVASVCFGYRGIGADGYCFDIKDVRLLQKFKRAVEKVNPNDCVYYEDFENSKETLENIVKVFSDKECSVSVSKKGARTGNKVCAVYAVGEAILIPFDKSKLDKDVVYHLSVEWKLLKYTEEKKRKIEKIYIVGYNGADGDFKESCFGVAGKGAVAATGRWENTNFKFKINECMFNKYEQFGILVCYTSTGELSKKEDTLFIDAITIKKSKNQVYVTPIVFNEPPRSNNTIKVLAFGNSFSNDGTAFIPQIAIADGTDLRVADCSIGGCSLKRHYNNSITNSGSYSLSYRKPDATEYFSNVNMEQALTATDWDYITIQQVSTLSGRPETYEPYLNKLLTRFKEYCPKAKIVFHMTWPYKDGLDKEGYDIYDYSQIKMYNAIKDTYAQYSKKYGFAPIIPSGETIQILRGKIGEELFATEKELSFTRDGFHLSEKGRVAAALTWYEFFTGICAEDTKVDLTKGIVTTVMDGALIGITEAEALELKKAAHKAALYKNEN